MKKFVKTGIVIALALISTLALCSCKALDDARFNHGIYLDENREMLEFRGNRYVEITSGLETYDGSVSFETEDGMQLEFIQSGWGGAYITEKDVPVLLKNNYGDLINAIGGDEETPTIITVYQHDVAGSPLRCYCREDKAVDIQTALKHLELDEYYLDVSGWDYETDRYFTKKDMVDSEVRKIISNTLSETYDDKTDYQDFYELYDAEDVSEEYLSLYSCDKEMIFTDSIEIQIVRTTGKNRKYFIAKSADGEWSYSAGGAVTGGNWFRVDDRDTAALDELFKQYQDHTETFYFSDYDYYEGDNYDSEF